MLLCLLLATGVMLVGLFFYGMATALMLHLMVRLIPSGPTRLGFWKNVGVMMIVTLSTTAVHLIQIALWAMAYLLIGKFSTFEDACYFSGVNYTSLGYGDIVLTDQWRLLGPLEAIHGLLLFGVSTALMFAVLSRLIPDRIRRPIG